MKKTLTRVSKSLVGVACAIRWLRKTGRCARWFSITLATLTLAHGGSVASFTGNNSYALVGTPESLQIPSGHPLTVEA